MRIGIIGFGYWGPNLYRNFSTHPECSVIAIADSSPLKREQIKRLNERLLVFEDGKELIDRPEVDAVVVASPVATHYPLAKYAIEKGKPVLVEKPICASTDEAQELVEYARRSDVPLMVDHTFLFNGAVQMIRDMYQRRELGTISYYDSMRVNLGLFQPDVSVLWDLAPHDFSIIRFILGEEPIYYEGSGYCHVNDHLPDIVYITAYFPSNVVAHFNLSWMSPVKVRRTAIGGSEKMVVWDDLDRDEPIRIYNSGIKVQPSEQRAAIIPSYRIGDVLAPRVRAPEPLSRVVDHFIKVIKKEEYPIMSGEDGLAIVRMLEKAHAAVEMSSRRYNSARQ